MPGPVLVGELHYLEPEGGTLRRLLHPGHTVPPGNSQSEYVTPWLVLAVPLTNVLPRDYLTPNAAHAVPGLAATGEG